MQNFTKKGVGALGGRNGRSSRPHPKSKPDHKMTQYIIFFDTEGSFSVLEILLASR